MSSPPQLQVQPPKSKDGLIRMLLQASTPSAAPPVGSISAPRFPVPAPVTSPIRIMPPSINNSPAALNQFSPRVPIPPTQMSAGLKVPIQAPTGAPDVHGLLSQLSGPERGISLLMLDHPYAKPWNWRPDCTGALAKPTKTLLMSKHPRSVVPSALQSQYDEFVDILSLEKSSKPPKSSLQTEKAKKMMEECENHANFANPNAVSLEECEDWEEKIVKEGWTTPLHRLFNKTLKILHADRLSRLAWKDHQNEPIMRRLMVDKSAKRLRLLLAGINWDTKLTQWLHNTLCDNLPLEYLICYVDSLQTLRVKVPTLVDKMISGRVFNESFSSIAKEGFRILMKRKWDPVARSLEEQRMKKIPGNPIIIFTPSGPNDIWHKPTPRARRWLGMLGQLGKFVLLTYPPLEKGGQTHIGAYVQQVVSSVISKIRDLKKGNHERTVVLIGWGIGSAINAQVASMENVSCLVNMGFNLYTIDGTRGETGDFLLDLKTPSLFVIGQNAVQARPDDVEDLRERMKCETGLIVVGSADDSLRVSKHKKRSENVTQTMVDRCIVEDMKEFIVSVFANPAPVFATPIHPGSSSETSNSSKKGGKRKNSKGEKSTNPKQRKTNKNKASSQLSSPVVIPQKSLNPPLPYLPTSPIPIANPSCVSLSTNISPTVLSSAGASLHTPISHGSTLKFTGPEKARKVLDMSQGLRGQDIPASRLMANSPLLSSALTSTTKTTTVTAPLHKTTIASPARLPTQPIPLPTAPVANSSGLRPPTVVHPPIALPTMPNIASMLSAQQPPTNSAPATTPLPPQGVLVPSLRGKSSGTPTVVRMITPKIAKSSVEGSSMVVFSSQQPGTSKVPKQVRGTSAKATSSVKSVTSTTASPGAAIIAKKSAPPSSTPNAPTTKENLLIFTLPQEQLKNLDRANLTPYSTAQILAVVTNDKSKDATTTKKSSGSVTPAPETPGAEKQNVAEILASLSGLTPEPQPKTVVSAMESSPNVVTARKTIVVSTTDQSSSDKFSKTGTNRPTAAILSSGGNSRIVRVLQTSGSVTPRTVITPPITSNIIKNVTTASSTTGQTRSRKQIFVTTAPTDSKGSNSSKQMSAPIIEAKTVKEVTDGDQDILEEDVSDLEYVPYQKDKKKQSPKGKTNKNNKNGKKA